MSKRIAALVAFLALAAGPVVACGNSGPDKKAPALSLSAPVRASAAPAFTGSSSPGVVPCGAEACPASKAGRRVCCNAPPAPAMCRFAERCGQATGFKYAGMLSCNEPSDCTANEPGRDVVCCLSNDGFKVSSSTDPYNRASCTPRVACVGDGATSACLNDADCKGGLHCRRVTMGPSIELGACLP